MGVDVSTWRVRIGGFRQAWSGSGWSLPVLLMPSAGIKLTLRVSLALALLLIISGDVETNPGPLPPDSSKKGKAAYESMNEDHVKGPDYGPCAAPRENREFEQQTEEGPCNPSIIDTFETVCKDNADRVAMVEPNGNHVTYEDLLRLYNNIVSSMRVILPKTETTKRKVIATFMPRSVELVVTILAAWKIGITFVMLNVRLPTERLKYILKDSGASHVIYDEAVGYSWIKEDEQLNIISYQDLLAIRKSSQQFGKTKTPAGDHIVSIFYTSGSTGVPKGVLIHEDMLYYRLNWMWQKLPLVEEECVAFKAPVDYAACAWEILGGLLKGVRTAIITEDGVRDPSIFVGHLYANRVTRLSLVPSLIGRLVEYARANNKLFLMKTLKVICCDGEVLTDEVAMLLLESLPHCQIINCYGSTEDGFDVLFSRCGTENGSSVSIGKPLEHVTIHLAPTPVENIFELYTSGPCVSHGYLNMPYKTKESFPFINGRKYYKTGDLVRKGPDGNLFYHGRSDREVKIRGNRVHLDEVETVLQSSPQVKEACVVYDGKIYAFFRFDDESSPSRHMIELTKKTKNNICSHLLTKLPDFMLPTLCYQVTDFPRLNNGKINKTHLINMMKDLSVCNKRTKEKTSSFLKEEILRDIWQDFGFNSLEDVGFITQGGHSLNAIDIVTEIQSRLGKNVPVSLFMNNCSYKTLLKYISGMGNQNLEKYANFSLEPVARNVDPSARSRAECDLTSNVSFQEEDILIYHKLYNDSSEFNILYSYELNEFQPQEIMDGIHRVVQANPVLCSSYDVRPDGSFFRKVLSLTQRSNAKLLYNKEELVEAIDFSNEDEYERYLQSFNFDPFSGKPLIKFILSTIRGSWQEKYMFGMAMHHLVADGISINHIAKSLFDIPPRPSSRTKNMKNMHYSSFVESWRKFCKDDNPEFHRRQAFWRKETDCCSMTRLPRFDCTEITEEKGKCNVAKSMLPKNLFHLIESTSKELGVTVNTIFISAMATTLSTYNQVDDVMFGLVHSNRFDVEHDSGIGFYADIIPLRIHLSGHPSTRTVILRTKEAIERSIRNILPSMKIFKKEQGTKEEMMQHGCLINFIHTLENASNIPDGKQVFTAKKPWPLELVVRQEQDAKKICLNLLYDKVIHSSSFMDQFVSHYLTLLGKGLTQIDRPYEDFQILSSEEMEDIMQLSTSNVIKETPSVTLDELFVDRVLKNPNEIAVVHQDNDISYKDLYCLSAAVAKEIRRYTGAHKAVCIYVKRSINLIAACIGSLIAGCFYVCIDKDLPEQRIQYMLNDVSASVILTDNDTNEKLSHDTSTKINIDTLSCQNTNFTRTELSDYKSTNTVDDLCYVLYTSGTTGKPKGVCVTHKCVIVRVQDEDIAKVDVGHRVSQISSFSFDVSVYDLYVTLTNGATLVLVDRSVLFGHPATCIQTIKDLKIDIMCLPTSVFHLMTEYTDSGIFDGISCLLIAGEKPNEKNVKRLLFRGISSFKTLYGPTEVTIFALSYNFNSATAPFRNYLGRPLAHTSFYITNQSLQLLPKGVPGEIVIGGLGVTNGYLNLSQKTKAKFIPDCFCPKPGNMLYKTGDQGVLLPNNELLFIRRNDRQVKIRGYRVELEEIEKNALCCQGIMDAAAVLINEDDGLRICLCVVCLDHRNMEKNLRDHLMDYLPLHAMPSEIRAVPKFPLNVVGKIDREALRAQVSKFKARLWNKNSSRSEIHDLFNAEFRHAIDFSASFIANGGNSLMALKLTGLLKQRFDVDVQALELLTCSNLSQYVTNVSSWISNTVSSVNFQHIKETQSSSYIQLTAVQEHLWRNYCKAPDSPVLNLPTLIAIDSNVHEHHLVYAVKSLLSRHPYLCCTYEQESCPEKVRINMMPIDEALCKCMAVRTLDKPQTTTGIPNIIIEDIHKAFDLGRDPSIRVILYQYNTSVQNNKTFVLTVIHHLAADAESLPVIHEQLWRSYEESLCGNTIDFATNLPWASNETDETSRIDDLNFWTKILQQTNLSPLPFVATSARHLRGPVHALTVELNTSQVECLIRYCNLKVLTPASVFLALFQCVLGSVSKREQVTVVVPVSCGKYHDRENNADPHFRVLPIITQVTDSAFSAICRSTQEGLLAAASHAGISLEDVLSDLLADKSTDQRNCILGDLMNVMYVFMEYNIASFKPTVASGLEGEYISLDQHITWAHNGLTLEVTHLAPDGPFKLVFKYDSNLLGYEFMERLKISYISLFDEKLNSSP